MSCDECLKRQWKTVISWRMVYEVLCLPRMMEADVTGVLGKFSYVDLSKGAHGFSVRAFDPAGNPDPTPASRSFTVTGGKQPAAPTAGKSVNVGDANGAIEFKCPGDNRFRPVKDARQIAVGCTVDATQGRVRLTSETSSGVTQTAQFYFGEFKIKQRTGETEVTLKLSGDLGCGKGSGRKGAAKRGAVAGAAASGATAMGASPPAAITARARSAAPSGSSGDRCDGSTYIKVARGVVSFRDFVADRTVEVRAGQQYSTK